jgi:hypothetical protein
MGSLGRQLLEYSDTGITSPLGVLTPGTDRKMHLLNSISSSAHPCNSYTQPGATAPEGLARGFTSDLHTTLLTHSTPGLNIIIDQVNISQREQSIRILAPGHPSCLTPPTAWLMVLDTLPELAPLSYRAHPP